MIIIDLAACGGTPYGITTLTQIATGCPRKVALNRMYGGGGSMATLTGTLIHALLEQYYKHGHFETSEVEWVDHDFREDLFSQAVLIACRTFRDYVLTFPQSFFGKILAVEKYIEIDDPSVIGIAPYTCKIDLVVKLNKTQCKHIAKIARLDLDPGIYIVDHKTGRNLYPNTLQAYANSVQPTAYIQAYNHTHKKPAIGALINHMTTEVIPKYNLIEATPINAVSLGRLHNIVSSHYVQTLWPDVVETEAFANSSRCYDYMSVCQHLIFGRCFGF